MAFLIQKITKQDKETIDKRVKEVPESDKKVCWDTELVLGQEAQGSPSLLLICGTQLL